MEVQPTTKILSRSFNPPEFAAMFRDDPLSKSGRYDDICGPDASSVLKHVGWSYATMPLTIGVQISGETIAVAFAGPIILDAARKNGGLQVDGINLGYTVHSEHEGKGFGLKASCLIILEADKRWKHWIQDGFLNIQTRSTNVRGIRLAELLKAHLSTDATFSVTLNDGSKLEYTGYRASWKDAVEMAKNLMLPVAAPVSRKPQKIIPKKDEAELLVFFEKCSIPERWRQAYSARNNGETLASIGQTHGVGMQLVRTWVAKTENAWKLYGARIDSTILAGDPKYLEQPFEHIINVSVRPQNCIKQENIYSISQLLLTSEEQLKKTSNMGAVSLNEIVTELAKHGLWLGMTEAEITEWNQPRDADEPETAEVPRG